MNDIVIFEGDGQPVEIRLNVENVIISPLPNPLPEHPKNGHKGEGINRTAVEYGR